MKKSNKKIRLMTLSIACMLLSACASQSSPTSRSSLDKMIDNAFKVDQATSTATVGQTATNDEIASALLPDINLSAPGSGSIDVEPRFDIKVHRAQVRSFFMGLVDDSNYNMILHPDVKGRITLDLKNVTVTEVMDVVRDVYGYDFEKTKTAFSVFPNTMRTRIFSMNYLNVNRTGGSNMSVSSGQVTESVSGTGETASTTQSVSGSKLNTESKSDFWVELKESLTALVGNKKGRNIVVSPQSGMVVVRAMPHEIRAVEKFINRTQNFVQRQVIIEAKILEVELNERFQTGINWAALQTSGSNSALVGQTGGGTIFGGSGVTGTAGNTGELNPAALSQISGTAATAFGGMFSLALNVGSDFSAFIEMLKSQGDVQVLSSPQVSTVNNQKAVIKVGSDEFFITDVTNNTTTTTAAASTQSNVELTPFFSGVALDVIPQISENGEIILHVHPTVSTVTEKTKNINISSGTALSVPLAISSIRESDSIIRAKSGQVVIIGGLMQNSVEQNVSKVPLLGDLPLLGALFRHTQDISKKSELVILLKPIVIDSDKQMGEQVNRMKSRFNQVRAQ
ncbi:MAG: pilus (MSHA type) biogenesis protein MshL [Gammaproteobacteria bacterium]|nr:pilus (MSHA type) biogenesis protein MshL [Gammaproteobacteria bacterium]MCW8987705.1 pilus (MSHA type) biogenesis protein MshL [Gammaproteobacteria bacterium]MCW9032454.1 pilus (MSHA type) biogenesis protein MshL [Gammaproteobacteria bacterium]